MAPVVTMKQLLESGVHFGHQTRRWNPKMKRYIFAERNGIYIIDLQQSLNYIDNAYEFVKETVAHGGTILFVGTKKQAQEVIAEQARRVGMPFVNQRWLGGMLTNFSTVYRRLQRLKELEEVNFDDVAASGMTKKELLQLRREKDKLERTLGGIRDMTRVPSAVWVVDTKKEHIAVSEARKLGIPVVAILDTNCDPDEVTYPIPGNDDAIRSVALLTRVVADSVADGLIARAGAAAGEEKPSADLGGTELATEEPLAEWERALLRGDEAAAAASGASAEEVPAATANGASQAGASDQAASASGAAAAGQAAVPAESANGATHTADGQSGTDSAHTESGAAATEGDAAAAADATGTDAAIGRDTAATGTDAAATGADAGADGSAAADSDAAAEAAGQDGAATADSDQAGATGTAEGTGATEGTEAGQA